MKKIKWIIIVIFILLSTFTYWVNAEGNKNDIIAYNKMVAKLSWKNLIKNLLSLNNQLDSFLQNKKSEKIEMFYKLNNSKLKSLLLESDTGKYLESKGYTIYFVDKNKKVLVDDWTFFDWFYADKILSNWIEYNFNEKDIKNKLESKKLDNTFKYALYDIKNWKIILTNFVRSKMDISITEAKNNLPYMEEKWNVTKDLIFLSKLWENNWRYYLYGVSNNFNLSINTLTFFDNKLEIAKEPLKNYTIIKNLDWKYSIWKVEKYDIWLISLYQNITNKDGLISLIAYDMSWYKDFNINDIQKIKDTTLDITKNVKTNDEKIKVIYDYIIDNTSYDYDTFKKDANVLDMNKVSNPSAFNWVWAFINKKAVCNWYVELLYFMLSFAWISDVEKIDWKVTTRDIWWNHSWLRIWNKYYDPTFDDWLSSRKYYWLNKDVILWDRVEWLDSNKLSLDQVFSNYIELSTKYNYEILDWYKTLSDLGIKNKNDLTFENLKLKLGNYPNLDDYKGWRLYYIENDTPDYYLPLIRDLWDKFLKWKLGIKDWKKYIVFESYIFN